MDELTQQQLKDIYTGQNDNPWQVMLLARALPWPYDLVNIKEVDWTTYKKVSVMPTIIDEVPDFGQVKLNAKATFTYNGPLDVTNVGAVLITDTTSTPNLLLAHIATVDAEDMLVVIGDKTYDITLTLRFPDLRTVPQ